MRENILKDKSFTFAVRIVKLYQYLAARKQEYVLSKQLLRSGTSVGAMVREAEHAQTKADFIHKTCSQIKKNRKHGHAELVEASLPLRCTARRKR